MTGHPDGAPMEPICVRISEATRLTSLGRTRIYELINAGELETCKIGATTLILFASLKALLERNRRGSSC